MPQPDAYIGRTSELGVPGGSSTPRRLEIDAELALPHAHLMIAKLYHDAPEKNFFFREKSYWVDLCLTPRRRQDAARFCDHWSATRFSMLGSLIALPPKERLELRSAGGHHASLLCQLDAQFVEKWLPDDFSWTERRLEASLSIANEAIQGLMLRLNQELRSPTIGSKDLCGALVAQLAIELARYFVSASDADEKGGLASWRQRIIDERVGKVDQPFPTVAELAALCKISTRQLSRGFKASRGCSLNDYLMQSRIEKAKRRLCTDDDIRHISMRLGFSSQSSFTAAFRRAVGVTPGEFRKRIAIGRPD